jgi:outer membrane protein assembly factor BamD
MIRHARRGITAAFAAAAVVVAGCGASLQEHSVEGVASYERGKESYEKKDYTDAIADLKAYVQQFPGTDNTDDALYYLGMSYFQIKDYPLASGQFDRLLRDFPASPRQPDALFQLARCDDVQSHPAPLDQTETLRAISRYKQFLDLYPESPDAPQARERLAALEDRQVQKEYLNGRLYYRLKQYGAAELYLRAVAAEHPKSQWGGQAAWLLGQIYAKRGRTEEAIAVLKQVETSEAPSETKREARDKLRDLEKQEARP